jgi:hypothetical protein
MSKPSEWGKPPFRYVMVGDSDGEQCGYDHMVYDADGEELTNAPNSRVGLLFGHSAEMLERLCLVAVSLDTAASLTDGTERACFQRDALAVRSLIARATGQPDPHAEQLERARKTDEFARFLDGLMNTTEGEQ